MKVIIDTNVPIVANDHKSAQASSSCKNHCIAALRDVQHNHKLVLDQGWLVIREYLRHLNQKGRPGVGDEFMLWVLQNHYNPVHCERITITTLPNSADGNDFAEFPTDPALINFDRADRKFVAIALAHPEKPPILNATDTDWWHHLSILEKRGVQVKFLCPDAMP